MLVVNTQLRALREETSSHPDQWDLAHTNQKPQSYTRGQSIDPDMLRKLCSMLNGGVADQLGLP